MSEAGEQQSPEISPDAEPSRQNPFPSADANWWEGGQKVKSTEEFQTRKLNTQLDKMTRKQAGRRSTTKTERKRGRYIRAVPAGDKVNDIAFDATLRAAAVHQQARAEQKKQTGMAYALRRGDLQRKIRVKKAANLILFVVDASWSMAVSERMQATKGAILSLLTDAYQRRDRVGLVVFQKDRASLVLPPTNSVTLAKESLEDIPVGGKTPLSAGLMLSYDTIRREQNIHPDVMPMMILLTDGAGNVSLSGSVSPQEEAHAIARLIKEAEIRTVTINMEHVAFDQGLAKRLAESLGGPCYTLAQLRAEALLETVRAEMDAR
jgi:magnesium chelatase subunit D